MKKIIKTILSVLIGVLIVVDALTLLILGLSFIKEGYWAGWVAIVGVLLSLLILIYGVFIRDKE